MLFLNEILHRTYFSGWRSLRKQDTRSVEGRSCTEHDFCGKSCMEHDSVEDPAQNMISEWRSGLEHDFLKQDPTWNMIFGRKLRLGTWFFWSKILHGTWLCREYTKNYLNWNLTFWLKSFEKHNFPRENFPQKNFSHTYRNTAGYLIRESEGKDNQKQHVTVLNEIAKVAPWNFFNTIDHYTVQSWVEHVMVQ